MPTVQQVAVIGLGRFGSALAETLYNLDYEVLGIDIDSDIVDEMADRLTHAVTMDATDARALASVGITSFDIVFVAMKEMLASILCTLALKELGCSYVIAKSVSNEHMKILERIGADRIVSPEQDMGVRLGQSIATAGLVDYIDMSDEFSIAEIVAPTRFIDKTVRELDLRNRYNLNIIAMSRNGQLYITIRPDDKIMKGDILVVIGNKKDIKKLNSD